MMVEAEPPTRLPRVPVVVKGPETAREEVAAAYERPELPAIRPERVPLVMGFVKEVEPEKVLEFARRVEEAAKMVIGAAPVKETLLMVAPGERAEAVAALVLVAMKPSPPLDQPRTKPPAGAIPKRVEVA